MRIIKVKDYDEMSKKAAEIIIERVRRAPDMVLGLATGGTPIGTYQELVSDHVHAGTSYRNVTTFNLDEYIGLSGESSHSYRAFMNKHLFELIDILEENIHIPNGVSEDIQKECIEYEELIQKHGGIDLQILGIGQNGHIGFNEPGTSFESTTHIVELDPSTREANARFFKNSEDVPEKAITIGIATIMRSKEILLLISGEQKRAAFKQLVNGEVDEKFPASVLKKHQNVSIIADDAARGD